jgi:hypothetical protein
MIIIMAGSESDTTLMPSVSFRFCFIITATFVVMIIIMAGSESDTTLMISVSFGPNG